MKTHPDARRRWRERRRQLFRNWMRPAPRLTVSQWAERHRYLSDVNSAEPGRFRYSRTPYLREIADVVTDMSVRQVVVMKSAQVGFTEGVLGNVLGYYIHQRPAPILMVQPSDGDAEEWSKEKLAPMIEATPVLRRVVAESKSRNSDNTILRKRYAGGSLRITGATSPKGLRRSTNKVLLFDEVDGYPVSAGGEGDPITIALKRSVTFWDRKAILGSTPTLAGHSRIEKAYRESDQREYEVPCPHCGFHQVLRWGGEHTKYGIRWEYEEVDGRKVVVPDSVFYLCENCAAVIDENRKFEMVEAGRWVARNPKSPIPGFHLNALISPFDGARWSVLAQEWLDAQGDTGRLQAFVNLVLGETWEDRGDREAIEALPDRKEKYTDESGKAVEVPDGVGLLVAGVDVQKDWLEVLVRGFGAGEESWSIAHHRIEGDTEREETWQRLEPILTRAYRHASGSELRIRATMIDSGFNTRTVYRFVRPRERSRNVWASKGIDTRGREPLSRARRSNRDGVRLWTIGTYSMKDTLFARLQKRKPGPGYMHFHDGLDGEFFDQFQAERAVWRSENGRRVRRYIQVRERNEAIDLEVLCLAAMHAYVAGHPETLARLADEARERGREEGSEAAKKAPKTRHPRRSRGGSWVNRWQP